MQGVKKRVHHGGDVRRGGISLDDCYIPGNGPEFAVSEI
jgi:hypothetical protein